MPAEIKSYISVIKIREFKTKYTSKYKIFMHQRPIDQKHVEELRRSFVKQGDKFKCVVGQIVLARTEEETKEDGPFAVLDGNHRWHAVLRIADDSPFLDCYFSCVIYDNTPLAKQKILFRNINSGLPMSGMYYADDYLQSTCNKTVQYLLKKYPHMLTKEPYKLWATTYPIKFIQQVFTRDNMEALNLNKLTGRSVANLIEQINENIFNLLDEIFQIDNWWVSEKNYLKIDESDFNLCLKWYQTVADHKNVRNANGIKKVLVHCIKQFEKNRVNKRKHIKNNNKRNNNNKRKRTSVHMCNIPFFLPILGRMNIMDVLENYDKKEADFRMEFGDDSIEISDEDNC